MQREELKQKNDLSAFMGKVAIMLTVCIGNSVFPYIYGMIASLLAVVYHVYIVYFVYNYFGT